MKLFEGVVLLLFQEQVKVTVDPIKPTSSRKDGGSSGGDVKGILWTDKWGLCCL